MQVFPVPSFSELKKHLFYPLFPACKSILYSWQNKPAYSDLNLKWSLVCSLYKGLLKAANTLGMVRFPCKHI